MTLPAGFEDALRRTPLGLTARSKITGLFPGGALAKRLEVKLSQDLVAEGRGDTQDLVDRIAISICISPTIADRMKGWREPEILNVVGVHEIRHIEPAKSDIFADDCGCRFCRCHRPHFDLELAARLEYSLIHPAESVSKAGWLDAYLGFFAAVNVLGRQDEYRELCDDMEVAPPVGRKKHSAKIRKYEKSHPPQPEESDFDQARLRAFAIYQDALADLATGVDRFAKDGLFGTLEPYKKILAVMKDYQADKDLALIP